MFWPWETWGGLNIRANRAALRPGSTPWHDVVRLGRKAVESVRRHRHTAVSDGEAVPSTSAPPGNQIHEYIIPSTNNKSKLFIPGTNEP